MKRFILKEEELDCLSEWFLERFKSGVVILRGDLASGKTTLVKNFVKKLNLKDDVTSPTFSLQQKYGEKIYHYDIYNKGLEHFLSLGMLEELENDGIHFIEWGDDKLFEMLKKIGLDVAVIDINKIASDKREYKICIN